MKKMISMMMALAVAGTMAAPAMAMPFILVGCGPDFANIHGQM